MDDALTTDIEGLLENSLVDFKFANGGRGDSSTATKAQTESLRSGARQGAAATVTNLAKSIIITPIGFVMGLISSARKKKNDFLCSSSESETATQKAKAQVFKFCRRSAAMILQLSNVFFRFCKLVLGVLGFAAVFAFFGSLQESGTAGASSLYRFFPDLFGMASNGIYGLLSMILPLLLGLSWNPFVDENNIFKSWIRTGPLKLVNFFRSARNTISSLGLDKAATAAILISQLQGWSWTFLATPMISQLVVLPISLTTIGLFAAALVMIVYPVGLGMQIFLRMFFPVDPKTGDLVLELEEDERIKNSIEGLRRDTPPLLVRASVFLKKLFTDNFTRVMLLICHFFLYGINPLPLISIVSGSAVAAGGSFLLYKTRKFWRKHPLLTLTLLMVIGFSAKISTEMPGAREQKDFECFKNVMDVMTEPGSNRKRAMLFMDE